MNNVKNILLTLLLCINFNYISHIHAAPPAKAQHTRMAPSVNVNIKDNLEELNESLETLGSNLRLLQGSLKKLNTKGLIASLATAIEDKNEPTAIQMIEKLASIFSQDMMAGHYFEYFIDEQGNTFLHNAINNGLNNVALSIIKLNKINYKPNKNQITPFVLALEQQNSDIALAIIDTANKSGSPQNQLGFNNTRSWYYLNDDKERVASPLLNTPLHWAVIHRNIEVVRRMTELGKSMTHTMSQQGTISYAKTANNKGKTPLDLAKEIPNDGPRKKDILDMLMSPAEKTALAQAQEAEASAKKAQLAAEQRRRDDAAEEQRAREEQQRLDNARREILEQEKRDNNARKDREERQRLDDEARQREAAEQRRRDDAAERQRRAERDAREAEANLARLAAQRERDNYFMRRAWEQDEERARTIIEQEEVLGVSELKKIQTKIRDALRTEQSIKASQAAENDRIKPFVDAIEREDLNVIERLRNFHYEINSTTQETWLHYAIKQNKENAALKLIALFSDDYLTKKNKSNQTALMLAQSPEYNNQNIALAIIKKYLPTGTSHMGWTKLGCSNNEYKQHMDNERDSQGNTALHRAVLQKQTDVALFIIENTRTINDYLAEKNNNNQTPLMVAQSAEYNNQNIALAIVKKYLPTGTSYMSWTQLGFTDNEYKEHMDKERDTQGNTALHRSVMIKHTQVTQYIVESTRTIGKYLSCKNNNKKTALMLTQSPEYRDDATAIVIVTKYVEENPNSYSGTSLGYKVNTSYGVTIPEYTDSKDNERDAEGNTALHRAVIINHKEVVVLLVNKAPAPYITAKNNNNKTALMLAQSKDYNNEDIALIIVTKYLEAIKQGSAYPLGVTYTPKGNWREESTTYEYSSDKERDRDGDSALHRALMTQQTKVAKLLAEKMPSLYKNMSGSKYTTPKGIAGKLPDSADKQEIIKFLEAK